MLTYNYITSKPASTSKLVITHLQTYTPTNQIDIIILYSNRNYAKFTLNPQTQNLLKLTEALGHKLKFIIHETSMFTSPCELPRYTEIFKSECTHMSVFSNQYVHHITDFS